MKKHKKLRGRVVKILIFMFFPIKLFVTGCEITKIKKKRH